MSHSVMTQLMPEFAVESCFCSTAEFYLTATPSHRQWLEETSLQGIKSTSIPSALSLQ